MATLLIYEEIVVKNLLKIVGLLSGSFLLDCESDLPNSSLIALSKVLNCSLSLGLKLAINNLAILS
jgi:hypothetical protein